jgi:lipoprotein-anchoring transpeptidase ErfK/SrfK
MPFQLFAAGVLAVMLAWPASAEPTDHATNPETPAAESLAEPSGGGESDADPASAESDGEADVETVESDPDPAAEPQSKVIVTVDKGIQEMTVWVDGVEQYTWPVSTGIAGYSTPSGTYTASSMNKIWYSKQWDNAPMPHAIFFTKKGHAIHGTNDRKHLGSPASHGCVRLDPKNAATLFDLVKEKGLENTQVVLTGVTPGGEYKVTQPQRRRTYPVYPGDRDGLYDRYGAYELPPVRRNNRRRRFFQPYYDSPPQQYQPQRRRKWFRAPGY